MPRSARLSKNYLKEDLMYKHGLRFAMCAARKYRGQYLLDTEDGTESPWVTLRPSGTYDDESPGASWDWAIAAREYGLDTYEPSVLELLEIMPALESLRYDLMKDDGTRCLWSPAISKIEKLLTALGGC